jgi:succinoglycan biosynthesis transport protein ExoP
MSDLVPSHPAKPGRGGPAPWRGFLRTLNRRKWLLLGAGLLPPLATMAALSLVTPQYTATTRLTLGPEASASAKAASMTATVDSTAFLEKVVEKSNLDRDPEFLFTPVSFIDAPWGWIRTRFLEITGSESATSAAPQADGSHQYKSAVDALRQRIATHAQIDAKIFAISVQSADRDKAKRLADNIASLYLEEAALADREDETRAAGQFSGQLSTLQHSADSARQAALDFRQQSGLGDTDTKAASRALSDLNSQLGQAQAQVLDRQSRTSALQRAQSSPDARGAATDLLTNPVIAALRVQESDASRKLLEVSQRYGENHPRVVEARAELAQVRGAIAAETQKIASSLDGELAAAQAREKQLQEQSSALEQRLRSSEQKEIELRQLERTAEKEDASYRELLRRVSDQSASQKQGSAGIRILTPASLPEFPSYPRYVEAVLVAVAGGLLAGLLWIGLLEMFDQGFRTGEQIERMTGRSLIGMIPALPRSTLKKSTPVRYVIEKPISAYAEALRSVQTTISLSSKALEPKAIMITSSVPGEGKSTFSCSLAQLVARSNPGKKIIIVDCDLRRSTVLKLLGAAETQGTIDEYLSGAKDLHMVIGRDEDSGLYYVPAKIDTVNSSELLASPKMRALVDALANEFDIVFLDTPPLMAVADPRVVAELADYIVFLIQWEKTDRGLAVTALKLLADVSKVGVVLSQVDLRRHARYGYADHGTYYSKYSNYYLNS